MLASLDGYMNIALEQTEEYVNGQLKNKYEDAFIRGNNGKTQVLTILFGEEGIKEWGTFCMNNICVVKS